MTLQPPKSSRLGACYHATDLAAEDAMERDLELAISGWVGKSVNVEHPIPWSAAHRSSSSIQTFECTTGTLEQVDNVGLTLRRGSRVNLYIPWTAVLRVNLTS